MNIQEALTALDSGDDEHWTSNGLPKVEVVQEATGMPVTRALITEAAPLFTRSNMVLEVPNPEPKKVAEPNTDPDEVIGDGSEAVGAAGNGDDEVDKAQDDTEADGSDDEADGDEQTGDGSDAEGDVDEVAEFLDKEQAIAHNKRHPSIIDAQALVDKIVGAKANLDDEVKKCQEHLSAMIQEHAPLARTARQNQLGIMAHIESQKRMRAARQNKAVDIAKLMGAHGLAPIDQVSKRKLGHGLNRVVRTPMVVPSAKA